MEVNSAASAESTLKIHEYTYVFTGTGYFKGIYSLQVKDDVFPYKMLFGFIAYALLDAFKKELKTP